MIRNFKKFKQSLENEKYEDDSDAEYYTPNEVYFNFSNESFKKLNNKKFVDIQNNIYTDITDDDILRIIKFIPNLVYNKYIQARLLRIRAAQRFNQYN